MEKKKMTHLVQGNNLDCMNLSKERRSRKNDVANRHLGCDILAHQGSLMPGVIIIVILNCY